MDAPGLAKYWKLAVTLIVLEITSVLSVDVESLGCWRDNPERAMRSMEGTHYILADKYSTRTDPVKKCARVATDHRFTVFGVQNGGQCFSDARAEETYNMYGPSNLCKDGKGGPWSSSVYSTKTFHMRMVSQRKEEEVTPWDPYCDHPIDLLLLVDGSGSSSQAGARQRWEEMVRFCRALVKGFDEHTHIGIVKYGSEPQVIVDMNKTVSRKEMDEQLSTMQQSGGGRTLNDALKLAWKEQLKKSGRDSANKVIVALTTGDIQYGLFGSSQFLTDHDVRVIAVGVDKNVHFDFLESIASNRSPSNIFSLNSEQLVDAAPFVYRDICNNAKATTRDERLSRLQVSTQQAQKAGTSDSAMQKAPQVTDTQRSPSNPTNQQQAKHGRHSISRWDPQKTWPLIGGQKSINYIYQTNSTNYPVDPFLSKKDGVARMDGTSHERMRQESGVAFNNGMQSKALTESNIKKTRVLKTVFAPMVLVNPSPDLHIDLTEDEVKKISNRHRGALTNHSITDSTPSNNKLRQSTPVGSHKSKSETKMHFGDKNRTESFAIMQGPSDLNSTTSGAGKGVDELAKRIHSESMPQTTTRDYEKPRSNTKHNMSATGMSGEELGLVHQGSFPTITGKANEQQAETNLLGLGELSQSYELHAGNDVKLHVGNHPAKHVEHQNLFQNKFLPRAHPSLFSSVSRENIPLHATEQSDTTPRNTDRAEQRSLFSKSSKPSSAESKDVMSPKGNSFVHQVMASSKGSGEQIHPHYNFVSPEPAARRGSSYQTDEPSHELSQSFFVDDNAGPSMLLDADRANEGETSGKSTVTGDDQTQKATGSTDAELSERLAGGDTLKSLEKSSIPELYASANSNFEKEEYLTRKALEARKKEIDRLLELIDQSHANSPQESAEASKALDGDRAKYLNLEDMEITSALEDLRKEAPHSGLVNTIERHIKPARINDVLDYGKKFGHTDSSNDVPNRNSKFVNLRRVSGFYSAPPVRGSIEMGGKVLPFISEEISGRKSDGMAGNHDMQIFQLSEGESPHEQSSTPLKIGRNFQAKGVPTFQSGLNALANGDTQRGLTKQSYASNTMIEGLAHPEDVKMSMMQLDFNTTHGTSQPVAHSKGNISKMKLQTTAHVHPSNLTHAGVTSNASTAGTILPGSVVKIAAQSSTTGPTQPTTKSTRNSHEPLQYDSSNLKQDKQANFSSNMPVPGHGTTKTQGISRIDVPVVRYLPAAVTHGGLTAAAQLPTNLSLNKMGDTGKPAENITLYQAESSPARGVQNASNDSRLLQMSIKQRSENQSTDPTSSSENIYLTDKNATSLSKKNGLITSETNITVEDASKKDFSYLRLPVAPDLPDANILDSRFNHRMQHRPALIRPVHPTLNPTAPPGFPTLFQHVRKHGIEANQTQQGEVDFADKSTTSMINNYNRLNVTTEQAEGDALFWARKQMEDANIEGMVPHPRHEPRLAWTESSFSPQKGEPLLLHELKTNAAQTSTAGNTTSPSARGRISGTRREHRKISPAERSKYARYKKLLEEFKKVLITASRPVRKHASKIAKLHNLSYGGVVPFILMPTHYRSGTVEGNRRSRENLANGLDDYETETPLFYAKELSGTRKDYLKSSKHRKRFKSPKMRTSADPAGSMTQSGNTNIFRNASNVTYSPANVSSARRGAIYIGLKEALQLFATGNDSFSNGARVKEHPLPDERALNRHTFSTESKKTSDSDFLKTYKYSQLRLSDLPVLAPSKPSDLTRAAQGSILEGIRNNVPVAGNIGGEYFPSMKKSHYFRATEQGLSVPNNPTNLVVAEPAKQGSMPRLSMSSSAHDFPEVSAPLLASAYRQADTTSVVDGLAARQHKTSNLKSDSSDQEKISIAAHADFARLQTESQRKTELQHDRSQASIHASGATTASQLPVQLLRKEEVVNPLVDITKSRGTVTTSAALRRLSNSISSDEDGSKHPLTPNSEDRTELHNLNDTQPALSQIKKAPVLQIVRNASQDSENQEANRNKFHAMQSHESSSSELKTRKILQIEKSSFPESNYDSEALMNARYQDKLRDTPARPFGLQTQSHRTDSIDRKEDGLKRNLSDVSTVESLYKDILNVEGSSLMPRNRTYAAHVAGSNRKAEMTNDTLSRPTIGENEFQNLRTINNSLVTMRNQAPASLAKENSLINSTHMEADSQTETNARSGPTIKEFQASLQPSNVSAFLRNGNWSTKPNFFLEKMTNLEYILGCNKPLRVLFAIDVSDGLGDGTQRASRWARLKQFIQGIQRDVIQGVETKYIVFNTEPRFLDLLEPCDTLTEYFMAGDECLCSKRSLEAGSEVCSTNAPSRDEVVEDWGTSGPRTGLALDTARKLYFKANMSKYKNLVFLISHKSPTDNVTIAESKMKKDGISLVDLELGDRHDLKRRSNISHVSIRYRHRREESENAPQTEHNVKVSLNRLQGTLRDIVSKICRAKSSDRRERSRIYHYRKRKKTVIE